MRGNPWLELTAVLAAVVLLSLPLVYLTRDAPALEEMSSVEPDAADTPALETWVDLQFSHPPVSWRLAQNSTTLAEGGGVQRDDADVVLAVQDNRSDVLLDVEWPEGVEQGYVEAAFEVGALPAVTRGGWGDGRTTYRWELIWPESP